MSAYFIAREISTNQLPIETKIAPVSKSYSALDFQADVVVCHNGSAKLNKLLHNIEIITVSRVLRPHTKHDPTRQQHIFRLVLIYHQNHFRRLPFDSTKCCGDILHRASNDVNVVGVRRKLNTLVGSSAIGIHTRLS